MTYQLTTLPTGLRVATEALPEVHSVALAFSVGVGARYETDAECGISHVLEHMAFKGTKTRSARDIAEQFDAIGGHFNAYTSMEHTVYYAKVLAEHVPVALDILSDILSNSVFDAEELKREQEVIVQEIAMYQDQPDDVVSQLFDKTAYPNQPMGKPIIGTAEQVMSYTRDNVAAYLKKHYAPSRIVFSAAGKVDHAYFVNALAGFVPSTEAVAAKPHPASYQGGEIVQHKALEQTHVLLGFPSLSATHDDLYTQNLLNSILGGGMSSRLFQEIREKRGLVYHVSSHASAYADTGMLTMYAATDHAKAPEALSVMRQEFERLVEDITEDELKRAKQQQRAELIMSRENPATVASWIGRHLLVYGNYRTLDFLLAKIDAVTLADLKRLGSEILARPHTKAVLGANAAS